MGVHVGRDADLLDVRAFRARCERHVVQVGDFYPLATVRAYGPIVVGGRETHNGRTYTDHKFRGCKGVCNSVEPILALIDDQYFS